MSSINIPIMAANGTATAFIYAPPLSAAVGGSSFTSICSIGLSLLWGSIELIISMGAITAFSHLLCFATALSMPSSTTAASTSSQLPTYIDLIEEEEQCCTKEKTCALVLSALLSGLHVVIVFFMLPLFRLGGDSFPLKNLYSIALLAAGTTGVVMGVIVVCLLVPVGKACARFLAGGASVEKDLEALRQQEEEQKGFLDKVVFQLDVKDVDAEEE